MVIFLKSRSILPWLALAMCLLYSCQSTTQAAGAQACCPDGRCKMPWKQPGRIVSRPTVPVRRSATPHPSVVRVINRIGNRDEAGSGTYIKPVGGTHGYVLSCEHLFNEGVGEVVVIFPDGSRFQAKIKAVDRTWDLAVMSIGCKPRPAVEMATAKPQLGETITFCGYGQGYGLNKYRCRSGKLARFMSPVGLNRYELLDVVGGSRGGDSGGPLFNSAGELVGVLTDTGIAEKKTAGPNCTIINRWLADVLNKKPADPVLAAPSAPQSTPSALAKLEARMDDEIHRLRFELASLEREVSQLETEVAALKTLGLIPAGIDGKRGPDGKRGLRGVAGTFDKKSPLFTAEYAIDGKVIRTEKVFPGGVLPLELRTSKRKGLVK